MTNGSKQTGSAASPPALVPGLEQGATTPFSLPRRSLRRTVVLVNGFDTWVRNGRAKLFPLVSAIQPGCHASGRRSKNRAISKPILGLSGSTRWKWDKVQFELFAATALRSPYSRALLTSNGKRFFLQPFLSAGDYHSMHHENGAFQFAPQIQGKHLVWHPYSGLPGILALSNRWYLHQPDWYRNFLYERSARRGWISPKISPRPGYSAGISSARAACILAAEVETVANVGCPGKAGGDLRGRASAAPELSFHWIARRTLPVKRTAADYRRGLPLVHRLGADTFHCLERFMSCHGAIR